MITGRDKQMICYFIQEEGDITRWANWEERKADIGVRYPELIAALDTLVTAERTLNAIVLKISNEI